MLIIFLLLSLTNAYLIMNSKWSPNSWRQKKVYQNVNYVDKYVLKKNEDELSKVFPLIYA